jgi:leucyl-tRNA synthetase
VTVPSGAGEEAVKSAVLGTEAVAKALEGRAPKKVIVVRGKLVNVVV